MRILVLGAGALGGYFGGRLLEAGADVAFLVRPRRRAQLERDGLAIESPYGALRRPVPLVSPGEAAPGWDVVLLACKAYDLEDAIAAIRPAVDERTAVLPVLNGVSHIEALQRAFGAERVLGGLAKIQATLGPDGAVRHLNDWRYLTFGEMDGRMSPRVEAIAAAASGARGVVAAAVPDIAFRLWEKLVHLGTSAVGTVVMRANVGEIVRAPGGAALLLRVLERNAAIAAAHGHPMREAFLEEYRAVFSDPASAYSASILRDLEAGGRIEADHILGFLLGAARRAGVPDELHEAAFVHAKAYEQRRDAGRLPAAR
ncbi:MAG: ketopantoate reductase family protein [Acetobacteraceae bacterium]|nr:ketopantoate reductase family protein [Acetobacteraceae bacterium]